MNRNFRIDTELKNYITPLSSEEYRALELSLISEGCRDKLILWGNTNFPVLVDGHNRFKICEEHNIPYETVKMDFETYQDVMLWISKNQLARRNLTDKQRTDLIGKIYNSEKIIDEFKGNQHTESGGGQNDHNQKTSQKIAEVYGINEKTVRRAEQFSKSIDELKNNIEPKTVNEMLTNEISITKKDIIELSKQQPETQSKIVDLITTKQAKNYKEAKQTLSPEQEWLKKEYKQIDKEHDNHRLVANLINETKFLKIDEQAVEDYLNLVAVDCFKTEFIQNCDRLINKLNEMKAYHSNLNKIRRIK